MKCVFPAIFFFVSFSCFSNALGVCLEDSVTIQTDSLSAALKYYDEGDYTKAVNLFLPLALNGNSQAQERLGYCFYKGYGVEQNYAQAVKWYRKAAGQGVSYAQYNLGQCYNFGIGVTKNYAQAVKWYRKAAEQGAAAAQHNLGGVLL